MVRNKTKLKTLSLSLSLLSKFNFPASFLTLLPTPSTGSSGTMRSGGFWSVQNTLALLLLPPHAFPLLQSGCCLQETVLSTLVQCRSFQWAALLHELLPHGSFKQAAVLQKQVVPVWSPGRSQVLLENLLLSGFLSRDQSFCQKPAPSPVLHELQLPSRYLHRLRHEVLHGLQCGYPLHCGHPWTARGQTVSPLSSPWLQGSLCSSAWTTFCSSFFTDLDVCIVVSLFLTLLSCLLHTGFYPFLTCVIKSTTSVTDLASRGAGCHWFCLTLGAVSGIFSQKTSLQPLHYQSIARLTKYTFITLVLLCAETVLHTGAWAAR